MYEVVDGDEKDKWQSKVPCLAGGAISRGGLVPTCIDAFTQAPPHTGSLLSILHAILVFQPP